MGFWIDGAIAASRCSTLPTMPSTRSFMPRGMATHVRGGPSAMPVRRPSALLLEIAWVSTTTSQDTTVPDPVRDGVASGWQVIDGSMLEHHRTLEADVVIVGTGAGGGTAADILARAGLSVVMIEEGGLYTSRDFRMHEAEAY